VTTFRADVRTGALGLLTGFAAANTGYNLACYAYRPAAFGNRPLAYVDSLDETINHTGTTLYQRTLDGFQLVFVWAPQTSPDEIAPVRDQIIDAYIGYAMARPHAISNFTVTSPTRVQEVELELDGAFYPASIVTHGDTLALEGSA
jgi:hypothetical protein